jgi:hypothetical protein
VLVLAVELHQLLEVVWVSLSATIVVSAAFALVVRESGRSAEARRLGDGRAAALHAALATILFVAFAVIVVYGVVIMLKK